MKIDGPFYAQLTDAAAEARRLADIGYDGVYTLEGSWDPFYPWWWRQSTHRNWI